ncbi:NAD(P)-dependent alcohol dehydrogenase [Novosphingobium sp. CECT 9465]|uniref:NAD(P)-dependent alcohol dehydrogenase n=1 Tax=Novosphingobium sp. CECT 9465 TaxID=2829794 RepID=UPI001E5EA9F0|nr:NAD(P)-dependent alcohol dehydrogenase [Novosphingobium sp. CECT 9465]CAH0496101.1 Aryl-alcohol dehydrogenase [Novosphingobium sp. CECT 9465]
MTAIRAAVCREGQAGFSIEEARIDAPRAGEVLVRIVGAGVCHTDMAVRDRQLPVPLPVVLGHEGSGVVEAVGAGVTTLVPGDAVVLSFASCGACPNCADDAPAYCYDFGLHNFASARPDGSMAISTAQGPVHSHFFGQSSFATHAIATERNVVKVPANAKDVPLELLGPLGCGLQTGAGAVLNSMAVKAGRSLAVFGAGAVGLSAIMAARIAGADPIIAIDLHDSRLALARELGATHTIKGDGDVAAALGEICPEGLNYAFDTTGLGKLIELAFGLLAPRGILGLVGASDADAMLHFNETSLMGGGKRVMGILEGDSDPQVFIPQLIEHHLAGRYPFDRLIETFAFDDINEAFEASESGRVIKPVLKVSVA